MKKKELHLTISMTVNNYLKFLSGTQLIKVIKKIDHLNIEQGYEMNGNIVSELIPSRNKYK